MTLTPHEDPLAASTIRLAIPGGETGDELEGAVACSGDDTAATAANAAAAAVREFELAETWVVRLRCMVCMVALRHMEVARGMKPLPPMLPTAAAWGLQASMLGADNCTPALTSTCGACLIRVDGMGGCGYEEGRGMHGKGIGRGQQRHPTLA